MLVSSRSFDEYVAMFGLDVDDLPASVLDCCAGAASFVAELTARGVPAIAIDPAYDLPATALEERVRADLGGCVDMLLHDHKHFTWSWYGSLERREGLRHAAAARFLADYRDAPAGRYRAASLPHLPFADDEFALAVCSHLLFTWAPELDRAWHRAALLELSRVATEVRVFPLVLRATGAPVDFLQPLMEDLRSTGLKTRLADVPYEFQRGAHQMLVVTRAG